METNKNQERLLQCQGKTEEFSLGMQLKGPRRNKETLLRSLKIPLTI